jgi:hypothetical protein
MAGVVGLMEEIQKAKTIIFVWHRKVAAALKCCKVVNKGVQDNPLQMNLL